MYLPSREMAAPETSIVRFIASIEKRAASVSASNG